MLLKILEHMHKTYSAIYHNQNSLQTHLLHNENQSFYNIQWMGMKFWVQSYVFVS